MRRDECFSDKQRLVLLWWVREEKGSHRCYFVPVADRGRKNHPPVTTEVQWGERDVKASLQGCWQYRACDQECKSVTNSSVQ